ncbi:hypothetical protein [Arthrobacter sp. CAN_A214]|uniref:hypothetical protein n=1 Tax=Arthrobacter sp. CAN_A214 TaxID=2787720 RepID=UPI0018CBB7B3
MLRSFTVRLTGRVALLSDTTDLSAFTRECEADNVLIAPGNDWFPAESTGPYNRLNYSGPNPGAYQEAARVIGQALGRSGG